jgi:hypothetical protein
MLLPASPLAFYEDQEAKHFTFPDFSKSRKELYEKLLLHLSLRVQDRSSRSRLFRLFPEFIGRVDLVD